MQNKTSYKNSTFKKISLLICALLMLLTATVLLSACGDDKADTGTEGLVYSYNDEDSTATVTGYIGSITDVVIPETIDGYTVTAIGANAFYACTGLTSVKISNSIIDIGDSAFDTCVSLRVVEFGYSVKIIGNYAFNGCVRLSSIEISDSVIDIGSYAFNNCKGLTSVTIGGGVENIGNYAYYGCTMLTEINFKPIEMNDLSSNNYVFSYSGQNGNGIIVNVGANVTKIPAYLFSPDSLSSEYAPKISKVVFNDNNVCSSIGNYAFVDCCDLIGVYVDSIEFWISISFGNAGANPLYYAGNLYVNESLLTELEIPDSVDTINAFAFYNCTSLTKLTIGSGVKNIGDRAFCGCTFLTVINFNSTEMNDLSSSNYIFAYAGQSDNGITVTIGANVTKIPAYLFSPNSLSSEYAPKISTVIFSDDSACKSIEENAFYYCSDLSSVYIDCIESWLKISFQNAYANPLYYAGNLYVNGSLLTELEITNGIEMINDFAFYNCSSLTTLTIGEDVTSIKKSAFAYCSSLANLTIGSNVNSMSDYVFYNCSSLEKINFNATTMNDLESNNRVFAYVGQIGNGITVNIGQNVTKIPAYLFSPYYSSSTYSPKITTVKFDEKSVCTNIGESAFEGCFDLTNVEVNNIETWLGISFENLSANPLCHAINFYVNGSLLTELVVPNNIERINAYAFNKYKSLMSISICSGVTSIGVYAFYGCSGLTGITIAESVISIGKYAFSGCENLSSVIFEEASGWFAESTSLLDTDLFVPSTASNYLTTTYRSYTWTRNETSE